MEYLKTDFTVHEHEKELGEFSIKALNLHDIFQEGARGYKLALIHYMKLFDSVGQA